MRHAIIFIILVMVAAMSSWTGASSAQGTGQNAAAGHGSITVESTTTGAGTGYFLVRYSPGVNWNHQISYSDQPGLKAHHEYLNKLYASDQLVLSGPLVSGSGGMSLLRIDSLEAAGKLIERDPGIETRILEAELIPWDVELSSLVFAPRRAQSLPENLEGTYRLRRIDPESRLNLNEGR
ncbi:MAG: YciI family protein [Proteobacteria bacterium]|jgi:uncharacterized protein YciI|nr:YciI family protein [Pseudomonadota bacterium]MDA1299226.1 YciI family protein [Pseudomonadota bacterium]